MSGWKGVALALAIGLVAGFGASYLNWNSQVATLKRAGAASAVEARIQTARADSNAFVVVAAVAKLDAIERAADAGFQSAQKRVAVFHDALHALVDSNAAAKSALDSLERAHADEVARLKDEKVAADGKVLILQAENVQLLGQVHALDGQIQDLNAQIQKLHAPPSLALKILKGATYVGAVVVGYEAGKKKG